jgi:hypothetical protein
MHTLSLHDALPISDYVAETLVAATIGRAISAVATALSIAQANVLAAAWLPAATFASIATMGGAAAAGTAGIASSLGAAAALSQAASHSMLAGGKRFHDGGMIKAHNGLAIDEIPIIAQTGEGVLSRVGMSGLGGADNLNRLNNGGGIGGDININIYGADMSSGMGIERTAEMLGFEIERKLRGARSIA